MKSLVVDIDDTISFTLNRDFANATPNMQLINKLNHLFDSGTEIHFVTARGNLSCKTREEARQKYEEQILEWFKEHNVKYTSLSFEKKLADYYIDDKAIRPDEFLSINTEILSGGLSGAKIERRNDRVFKTHQNTPEYIQWYHIAKLHNLNLPYVYSVIGDTIQMDYIESKTSNNKYPSKESVIEIINEMKSIPAMYYQDFDTYINRIKTHLDLYNPDYKDNLLERLQSISKFMNKHKSFCHGDLSIDNMIVDNNTGKTFLIDANMPSYTYQSWLLDVSKFFMSLDRFNINHLYNRTAILLLLNIPHESMLIRLLEITHWIRMRKYHNHKEHIDANIKRLLREI